MWQEVFQHAEPIFCIMPLKIPTLFFSVFPCYNIYIFPSAFAKKTTFSTNFSKLIIFQFKPTIIKISITNHCLVVLSWEAYNENNINHVWKFLDLNDQINLLSSFSPWHWSYRENIEISIGNRYLHPSLFSNIFSKIPPSLFLTGTLPWFCPGIAGGRFRIHLACFHLIHQRAIAQAEIVWDGGKIFNWSVFQMIAFGQWYLD